MSTRLESYCVPQIIVDYVIQEIYVHIIRYCFSQICETLVMLFVFCVTFSYGALRQGWCLIVSIPGLCLLPYVDNNGYFNILL